MLQPIYELIFQEYDTMFQSDNRHRLALKRDEVVITYMTYKSTDPTNMQAIVDQKLAPSRSLKSPNQV